MNPSTQPEHVNPNAVNQPAAEAVFARRLRRLRWCTVPPLALGLGSYLAWRIGGGDAWMLVGWAVLGLGVVASVLGLDVLVRAPRLARGVTSPRSLQQIAWHRRLLVGNWVVAILLVLSAVRVLTEFRVELQNEAATPWTDVVLRGGGVEVAVGTVPPGRTAARSLWFVADGHLELHAAGLREPFVLDGYVTNGMSGAVVVRRGADAALSLTTR